MSEIVHRYTCSSACLAVNPLFIMRNAMMQVVDLDFPKTQLTKTTLLLALQSGEELRAESMKEETSEKYLKV